MHKAYDKYIISAIKNLPEKREDFSGLKKKLCKEFGLPMPSNADLRDKYNELLLANRIKRNEIFEKLLMSRLIRTQSGVAVVAVLTKSYPCPGSCIYCPSEKDMPKSYLSNEPAVMRAIDSNFDPYRQMQNRLRSLELNGHQTDKIELIVMGGTFSFLPKVYQKKFITRCFQGANEYSKNQKNNRIKKPAISKRNPDEELEFQQKKNETAKHRIIGLTLETRPDYINEKEILNFRQLGCTRVELGVQSLYDDVLELNKRGHLIASTVQATKMLKDAGFKINYHMMPGLPGSTLGRDFEMFQILFGKPPASRLRATSPRFEAGDFQPDMLKIYPTVVLKNSALYNIWKKKKYVPLTNQAFERLVVKIKNEVIPPYVRIARLIRDVPTTSIIAGPTVSNLRQIIIPQSKCPCIRCREVGAGYKIDDLPAMLRTDKESNQLKNLSKQNKNLSSESDIAMQAGKIVLDRIDYSASDGKEIFLQYVSPDKQKLFALLRLRIPSENNAKHFIGALKNSAIIREVHTYGKLTKIDKTDSSSPQHIGLGKKLLLEAERIAKEEYGFKKIVVISGVGVRNYYRKSGYRQQDSYMVKSI